MLKKTKIKDDAFFLSFLNLFEEIMLPPLWLDRKDIKQINFISEAILFEIPQINFLNILSNKIIDILLIYNEFYIFSTY